MVYSFDDNVISTITLKLCPETLIPRTYATDSYECR